MAQIKNGMIKGVVGTEIFGKVELHVKQGMQQMRSASSSVTNTQTAAQMYQRLKMLTAVPLYRVVREATALGWENVPQGQSQYNCYMGLAMRSTPYGITKELYDKGAGIAWPAQITQGTLPVITINGQNTNIALSGISKIDASTKVSELAQAIVEGNRGIFEYDDELAFIEVIQSVDSDGTPKLSCSRTAVILDRDCNETLAGMPSLKGFSYSDGYLGMSGAPAMGGYCWVHSRMENGKLRVSSQSLVCNNDTILDAYSDAKKLRAAAKSLGADLTSEKFLKPTDAKGRLALKAFDINLSRIKGVLGGGNDGVVAVEYAGETYFGGDEAPIMDIEAAPALKIVVSDGSKLAGSVQVRVNGTQLTSPTKLGNTITATIPGTLDGMDIAQVVVADPMHTWKLEF